LQDNAKRSITLKHNTQIKVTFFFISITPPF